MREVLWRAVCRVCGVLEFALDASFEAVCLFALLGLVLSVLLLDLHVGLKPPVPPISVLQ